MQRAAAVQDPADPSIWRAELTFSEAVEHNLYATAYDNYGNPTTPRASVRKLQVITDVKPDLLVSRVKLDAHQRPVVTVENEGTGTIDDASATEIILRATVDGDILEFNINLMIQPDQAYRAIGGISTIMLPTLMCGTHNVNLTVDAGSQLDELDETNNEFNWISP